MPCFVPFNSRNLDISFFVFRPVGVLVEDFVEALKAFSFFSEDHGCTNSAVFKSIHGNLVRPHFPFNSFSHLFSFGYFFMYGYRNVYMRLSNLRSGLLSLFIIGFQYSSEMGFSCFFN